MERFTTLSHYKHQNRETLAKEILLQKMGKVIFEWGEEGLTLLHSRDNWDFWMIKGASWNEDGQILGSWLEPNGGTWCGISKTGRVAFLLDAMLVTGLNRILSFPLNFLKGEMSPAAFASQFAQDHLINDRKTYHLFVADINSKSMFRISKLSALDSVIHTEEIRFGVHTLSSANLFATTEYRRSATTSITVLSVYPTKDVVFFETYLEDMEWKNHNFKFKIA